MQLMRRHRASIAIVLAFAFGVSCRGTATPSQVPAPATENRLHGTFAGGWRFPDAREASFGASAMVSSNSSFASQAGLEVLRQGGNAMDAAVAVGFALAVTFPFAGNVGGGGFMTIRMADGRTAVIDYREIAPLAATRDMFVDASGKLTDKSVTGTSPRGCRAPSPGWMPRSSASARCASTR